MKVITAIALVCALGCAGSADELDQQDAPDALGQDQEAIHLLCQTGRFHYYGVDVSFPDWSNQPCNSLKPDAICAYPADTLSGPNPSNWGFDYLPFGLELGNSWSTSERNGMLGPGQAAANYFTAQLGGACTNHTGLEDIPYRFGTTVGSNEDHVTVEKGSIPGQLNSSFDWVDAQAVIHMACTRTFDISEGFPMARATRCAHWGVTFDYAKLIAWGIQGGRGAAGATRALQNAFGKMYSIGIGLGWDPPTHNVNSREIRRDVIQTGWALDGKSLVCTSSGEDIPVSDNILTCL